MVPFICCDPFSHSNEIPASPSSLSTAALPVFSLFKEISVPPSLSLSLAFNHSSTHFSHRNQMVLTHINAYVKDIREHQIGLQSFNHYPPISLGVAYEFRMDDPDVCLYSPFWASDVGTSFDGLSCSFSNIYIYK